MTNATRLERLENLRRILQTIDRAQKKQKKAKIGKESVKFDMSTWVSRAECGTSCCALGACTLDPWFTRRGLRENWITNSPEYKGQRGTLAAEAFFGISISEAYEIFVAHRKASVVIKIVNRAIRRYSQKEVA